MKKYETVKKNFDFNEIINNGISIKSKYFNIYYINNDLAFSKFGIAVSKKFGNAVRRNKAKRQVRSLIDNYKKLFPKSNNYIIMIKKGVINLSFSEMEKEFAYILQKGFLNEKN